MHTYVYTFIFKITFRVTCPYLIKINMPTAKLNHYVKYVKLLNKVLFMHVYENQYQDISSRSFNWCEIHNKIHRENLLLHIVSV